MKNFKKFALVFVLILSFGLIFTTGCNLFGGNGDGDGDSVFTGKTTLTIDEIDDMVSQNLFSHFSGVDATSQTYSENIGSFANTILFDGESLLRRENDSIKYSVDGMEYVDYGNGVKTKKEYFGTFTTQIVVENAFERYMFNNTLFKINICEELITSNSVTETANGYKVKLVLNTTKAAELDVILSDYACTKYEITYEFNSQDKLVGVNIEASFLDQEVSMAFICSIKDYAGTVSAPEGFDPDDYTLVD